MDHEELQERLSQEHIAIVNAMWSAEYRGDTKTANYLRLAFDNNVRKLDALERENQK